MKSWIYTILLCKLALVNNFFPSQNNMGTVQASKYRFFNILDFLGRSLSTEELIQASMPGIDPCFDNTARDQGSFTTMVLWSVKSFNSPTVCQDNGQKLNFN